MSTIEDIDDVLWRIELEKPDAIPDRVSRSNNVYVLGGDAPALINAGHPSQFEQLVDALREVGHPSDTIERIIYTSWHVDSLGGATNFPGADHFVFSPDMVAPHHYEQWIESYRAEIRGLADEVLDTLVETDEWSREEVEDFVTVYLPRTTDALDFVPFRHGHTVAAGNFELEAVAAAGPPGGHCFLFDADSSRLFYGDFTKSGFPLDVDDVDAYTASIERAVELEPDVLLPTYGKPSTRAASTLQSGLSFCTNFLTTAPLTLGPSPDIFEFLERDVGHRSDSLVDFIYTLRSRRAFLDELVATGAIQAEGRGLRRKYGVDVDDPRDVKLR